MTLCSVDVYLRQLRQDIESLRLEQRENASVYGGQLPAVPPVPLERCTSLSEVSEERLATESASSPCLPGISLQGPQAWSSELEDHIRS